MSLYQLIKKEYRKKRKARTLPGRKERCFYKGTPRCTRYAAVLTVEAALILPLLMGFFAALLFLFRVMQVELEVQKALDDTGRKLAVYLPGKENDAATGLVMANVFFSKELDGREMAGKHIYGGRAGISLQNSRFVGDEVQLYANYCIRFPIRLLFPWDLSVSQKALCRKWTGWNGTGTDGSGDTWVYITETGQVYHTTGNCTHLVLSVQSVERERLGAMRNAAGGKYQKCLLCSDVENIWGRVYVTNQGDRYHSDLNCSGIKRTVFMVRLSEVGTRSLCSRCSGGTP